MDGCEVIGPGPASWGDTHGPCRDAESSKSIPSLLLESRRCPWFQLMWTGLDSTPTKRAKAQTVRGFERRTRQEASTLLAAMGRENQQPPPDTRLQKPLRLGASCANQYGVGGSISSVQATPCLWPGGRGRGDMRFLIPCAVCATTGHGNREKQSELDRIFGGRQCDGSIYGASKQKKI